MNLSLLAHLPTRYLLSYALLGISALCYTCFWLGGIIHAAATPKANLTQRIFWAGAMFVNPTTIVWYWYIWKRWAFWLLFTPIFGVFVSLPFVVRSQLTHADASKFTNTLFALGTQRLVILFAVLMIFPLVQRLAALFHLGKNTALSAMDRNDWVIALSFPLFGFGAGLAYTARYQRKWAIVSLAWWVAIVLAGQFITTNITQALVPAGDTRRTEFRAKMEQLRAAP